MMERKGNGTDPVITTSQPQDALYLFHNRGQIVSSQEQGWVG